jgi:hypothetical protein
LRKDIGGFGQLGGNVRKTGIKVKKIKWKRFSKFGWDVRGEKERESLFELDFCPQSFFFPKRHPGPDKRP